ncbi:MAG: hypothetical protein ABFD07_09330 [Methanobacterium sp.]
MGKNIFGRQNNLENWMLKRPDSAFPSIPNGETLPNKYKELKDKISPLLESIKLGAMVSSIEEYKKPLQEAIESLDPDIKNNIEELKMKFYRQLNIVYLNDHGTNHIKKVISKTSDILQNFIRKEDMLTPYEAYLLLCAIQLHDIGNIWGRDGHEKKISTVLNTHNYAGLIGDTPTKAIVFKIAEAHSGRINDDKDTISFLSHTDTIYSEEIRTRLMAALLRFADELADDASRADLIGIDMNNIPAESLIYHQYSKCLHSVMIKKNEVNKTFFIELKYAVDADLVKKKYLKNGTEKFFLDEILSRIKKVEQERRYCMHFFSQYIPLCETHVKIEFYKKGEQYCSDTETIKYVLNESGYPSDEGIVINESNNTAELIIADLEKKGWEL